MKISKTLAKTLCCWRSSERPTQAMAAGAALQDAASVPNEAEDKCSEDKCLKQECASDFTCPICLETITEAVWLVDTRQLFDRKCLVAWFEAGGRMCPATGLRLPQQVRLRAAPDLQRRINARQGLPTPPYPTNKAPANATQEAQEEVADTHARPLQRLWRRARAQLARFRRLLAEAPALYPSLYDSNWAQHL